MDETQRLHERVTSMGEHIARCRVPLVVELGRQSPRGPIWPHPGHLRARHTHCRVFKSAALANLAPMLKKCMEMHVGDQLAKVKPDRVGRVDATVLPSI